MVRPVGGVNKAGGGTGAISGRLFAARGKLIRQCLVPDALPDMLILLAMMALAGDGSEGPTSKGCRP
jgi:hypothetical protein